MRKFINDNFKHFFHGGDYNPEQWRNYPDVLEEDMRLFKLANCNEMTVGIFSWAVLEPEENIYDFSHLDKAFDDVYNAGGRIILATPSAARPRWLAEKYPEVLQTQSNFERIHFGNRHNHCNTSEIYREKVFNINKRLAERYKDHPALVAWHISNEYGSVCYCEKCRQAFINWLKDKYKTLDCLNEQWWTTFWSHNYTDWNQIEPPTHKSDRSIHGLNLDWHRFTTYQTTDFMKNEIAAIRTVDKKTPTTTNFMGFFYELDYRVLANELDFISDDVYPSWKNNEADDLATAKSRAMEYDMMRCLKKQPFMIMESTPSHVNWQPFNKLKRPKMHMLASLQTVAHGSDAVEYFQWRKSRGSVEKFHGAVVDHVGNENTRVFKDVAELGERLKKLDAIVGSLTDAKVGLYFDWSNRWALDDSQGFALHDKKFMPTLSSFYSPLWDAGIDVDVIGPDDDFSHYKLIIAPMCYMVSDELSKKIERFIANGGTFISTYMLGMVNENDLCHLGGLPGAGLSKVFGIWNEEIDTLYPEEYNVVRLNNGDEYKAIDYCEILHTTTAKALAVYTSDFYKDLPAITVNEYGKGKAYYIGFRDDGSFVQNFIKDILKETHITSGFDAELPFGVTAHTRYCDDTLYVFIENHTSKKQKLKTNRTWKKVENDETLEGEFILHEYEVIILYGSK